MAASVARIHAFILKTLFLKILINTLKYQAHNSMIVSGKTTANKGKGKIKTVLEVRLDYKHTIQMYSSDHMFFIL